jgi:large subunit ribosomal protein L30e
LEEANAAKIPTLQFDGNSIQLGRLCNKTFRISTISLKVGNDDDIQELLNEFGKK